MNSDFMVDQVTVDYRLSKYVLLSTLFYLIFALPTMVFLILFHLTDIGLSLFLIGIFLFTGAPITGFFSWLIVKGSEGANAKMALKVMGGLPGGLYGFILGGFLGSQIAGQAGGIILAIILFMLGRYLGLLIGYKIGNRSIFVDVP